MADNFEADIEKLDRNDVDAAVKLWQRIEAAVEAGKLEEEESGGMFETLAMLQDDPEAFFEATRDG